MGKYKLNWNNIFNEINERLVERLKEEAPVHEGNLKESIKGKVKGDILEISMNPYAIYCEYGTLPHPMNPEWLRKWCADILRDEDARFAVAAHIRKFGTEPHPFMRPILDTELKDMVREAIISLGEDAIMRK